MKISVCIATFNGEKYIKEQIESILIQLSLNDEVIVSDDKSTDETLRIIRNFKDDRIRIYNNKKFNGVIKNFENAIIHATGDYIFLSDQDDKWLKGKVEVMIKALQNNDLVISNAYIGDRYLNIVRDSYFAWRDSRVGIFKNFFKNSYLGCCMAFKKEILDIVIPFPENIPMHDMWIGMIAELYFKPVFIDDKLIIYRRHQNNATFLKEDYTSNESIVSKIKFRVNLLHAVIVRSIEKRGK